MTAQMSEITLHLFLQVDGHLGLVVTVICMKLEEQVRKVALTLLFIIQVSEDGRLAKREDDEPFDITLPSCRSECWSPNEVHLLGRPKQEQRTRFQIMAKVKLDQDDTKTNSFEQSETELRAEIAEALTLRIEERRRRLSESKRSERAKAKREEEQSMEPQPVGDTADTNIDD